MELGIWDTKVADLILPGIAFSLKKNILIFQTNAHLDDHPIRVITPGFLGGEADCRVPLVFSYNGSHYEGMIPETIEDEQKCHKLVDLWQTGQYLTKLQDIPVLWNQLSAAVSLIIFYSNSLKSLSWITLFFRKRRQDSSSKPYVNSRKSRCDMVLSDTCLKLIT